ncbi:unnamed protein product [Wuchereria bancrofti]|nr:unnamed protein product [Wuchereria bancrofti]
MILQRGDLMLEFFAHPNLFIAAYNVVVCPNSSMYLIMSVYRRPLARAWRNHGGLRIGRSSASSLTDSLRSVVRLRRAVSAHSKAERTCEQKASKRPGTVKRPRCWRFSIGSAPLTSITKIDAQVRGGETRQDYKDTRRFPLEAPSCALLFRPCRLPDTCPPFSLREAWRFLIAHAPDRCALSGNYRLESNPVRHDLSPLAAATGNRISRARGVMSHIQRETSCSRPRLNSNMDADLYGYKWARDNVGQSGATIYRLYGKPDAPELFLKHGKGSVANDVTDEMVRLNWLTEFMPLPTIKHFIRTPDDAWLLTTAIPGKTAFQVLEEYPDSGENIVDALAVFLRRLHSIPVCNCPFNSDRVFRLAQAQSRMNNGLVDASDFDDERNGWPVEQVWKEMHKLLPFSPDSVVTHGDFSLDNLIFDEGKLIGCIDVGRVGIADRYQDLAILWNCLGEFSPSLQKRLFQKYGIDNPDMNKLQFHLMLDEFF